MYLMAVRRGETAQAEIWRQKILTDFADSPYGKAMTDPNYFENLRRMNDVQEEMYQQAYDAYLNNKNSTVHQLTAKMEQDFPLSKIMPKFIFIDALSYLTENDKDKFQSQLTALLDRYPNTDMTDMAGSILKGLKAGREPHAGLSNSRGMIWSMRLSNDTTLSAADGQPLNFERDPNAPHYLVLAFPRDSVSANQLLYDVARFNFSSFVVSDFDLEPMSFGNVGLLIIKGFANIRHVEHYRKVMAEKDFTLPDGVRPIMISKSNFELLLREGRSFEEYFRFEENKTIEETEAKALEETEETEGPQELGETEATENSETGESPEPIEKPKTEEPSEKSEAVEPAVSEEKTKAEEATE